MEGAHASQNGSELLEEQIRVWRSHLRGSHTISGADAAELEDHLREQIDALGAQGLAEDEAFLVAVKRMGAVDELTREFAREHSERLWKQLLLADGGARDGSATATSESSRRMWTTLCLAVAAGVAIKAPVPFGITLDGNEAFYLLNAALLVLPFLAAYFAWERPLTKARCLWVAGAFAVAALVVNLFPFQREGAQTELADTGMLTALHLPIVLWLIVGAAYVGGRLRGSDGRMHFVRYTGEFLIYYALLGMGGMLLIGLTFALFQAIGIDVERVVGNWIVPCGAAGATLVASWLVEAKQSVVENMAPVLTRVFAPLFTLVLVAFLATMVWTGRGIDVEREVLIAFDLVLVVVFGLLLYSFSARDPLARGSLLDWIQLALVGTALLADGLALWAITARITEFGFTPNRVAALGENVILLVNLAGTALFYARFLRGHVAFAKVCAWQTGFLWVIGAWAAAVAFLFPPLFGFD